MLGLGGRVIGSGVTPGELPPHISELNLGNPPLQAIFHLSFCVPVPCCGAPNSLTEGAACQPLQSREGESLHMEACGVQTILN